jgi:Protein of unknown function (DUF2934)
MKTRLVKARAPTELTTVMRPTPEEVQRWIAEAAYYRAERRGFEPGYEVEDWLAAEAETRERLDRKESADAA